MLYITPDIQLPDNELVVTYARSSGPGGQNVNKVNSKAVLHWNMAESPSLDLEMRARLLARLATRMNRRGELVITSDRFRDQPRNREDCFEKLRELVAAAAVVPKRRRKTKPSYSSVQKIKSGKRLQSRKKDSRRRPGRDD